MRTIARYIPTYAGKANPVQANRVSRAVHPRVRRETPKELCNRALRWFIPTCAGKARIILDACTVEVHPRVCGETSVLGRQLPGRRSDHPCPCAGKQSADRQPLGSSPACGGSTRLKILVGAYVGPSPRVRETDHQLTDHEIAFRFIPARGKQLQSLQSAGDRRRFIPARGGKWLAECARLIPRQGKDAICGWTRARG